MITIRELYEQNRWRVTLLLIVLICLMLAILVLAILEKSRGAKEFCESQNKDLRIAFYPKTEFFCDAQKIYFNNKFGWLYENQTTPIINISFYNN